MILFAIILVISVIKSIKDWIESAIKVEKEKAKPTVSLITATIKFNTVVINIILLSFIFFSKFNIFF